jgi:hypothetical protein
MRSFWVPDMVHHLVLTSRAPGYTQERALLSVAGLAWPELVQVWDASTRSLNGGPRAQVGVVLLREAVLEEMQASHPDQFGRWWPVTVDAAVPGPRQGRRAPERHRLRWWERRVRSTEA